MKPSLLIIDDDSRNIFALSAILKAKGYATLSANSVKEAYAQLEQDKPIVAILLDMMMPETDGYEALPLLKSDQRLRHIPVIAVTAQAMQGDREKCLEAGADGYVSKPVDIDQLLNLLNALIK